MIRRMGESDTSRNQGSRIRFARSALAYRYYFLEISNGEDLLSPACAKRYSSNFPGGGGKRE